MTCKDSNFEYVIDGFPLLLGPLERGVTVLTSQSLLWIVGRGSGEETIL